MSGNRDSDFTLPIMCLAILAGICLGLILVTLP